MAEQILLYPFRNRIKRSLGPSELEQWIEYQSLSIMKWQLDTLTGRPDGAFTDELGETEDTGQLTGSVGDSEGGICQLTTTASSGKYIGVYPNGLENQAGAGFKGNLSAVTWARIKTGSVLAKFEVGFIDDDDDAGAVNSLAGPTTNSHDCAVWCYDPADTGGLFWQGVHSANSQTPSKVEPGKFLPVINTYEWLGVALLGSAVKFMHADAYGNPNYESGWQASGITATDSLSPWIFVKSSSGTEVKLDINCWTAYQRRTSAND